MTKNKIAQLVNLMILLSISLLMSACGDDSSSPTKSSDKKILSFKFEQLTPVAVGTIDETAKTIVISVPITTDLTSLVPTITVSSNATISPATGVPMNFTNPVDYIVTAEDGTTQKYTVTVTAGSVTDPMQLNGTLNQNTTLKNRNDLIDYIIDGTLNIDGNALLTIEAGVTIRFTGTDGFIDIGENCGLKAVGTVTAPIVFDGPVNNNNKGAWAGIRINSQRDDNEFKYVVINNAGANNYSALSLANNAKIKLSYSAITNSAYIGLDLAGGAKVTEFNNNRFINCDNFPIYLSELKQSENFDATTLFENNKKQFVNAIYAEFEEDFTLRKINIPYAVTTITIYKNKFTIAPGVNILFDGDGAFNIAEAAILIAEGTAQNPILFSGQTKSSGSWYGIYFNGKLDNVMKNCVIEYSGKNEYSGIDIADAKIILENINIKNCEHYGINFNEYSEYTKSNIQFSNCKKGNVYNESTDEVLTELP